MPDYLEKVADKFTFRVALDRLYSADGLWLLSRGERPGHVRVGLTDYMQQHSGDVAFAAVKDQGTRLTVGDDLAELETVKVTVALPSPVSGTIVEVNPVLDGAPEAINQDPYGKGWLAVIEVPRWESERVGLLEPKAYFSTMDAQVEQELRKK